MIIDSHTHIFSPDVIAHRERYAKRDAFFGTLYSGAVARMIGAEELIAAMDVAGIDKAVVTGWCWQNHDVCVEQNSWTMEMIRKYPIACLRSRRFSRTRARTRFANSNDASRAGWSGLAN